jgi:hypothetical protein
MTRSPESRDAGGRPRNRSQSRALSLAEAAEVTRTGDIWLFRGRTVADRAIQTLTNSPVNHVGMAVVLDDLPPLLWHAELGRSLPDVWAGARQRGAQLHRLEDAVVVWAARYGQRAWLRQLGHELTSADEEAVLRTIARLDGTPFPTTAGLAGRWYGSQARHAVGSGRGRLRALRGREPRTVLTPDDQSLESAYCAEVVAMTYQAMGLLPADRPPSWYDPGRFWTGDALRLERDALLGVEIAVDVPVG